MSRLLRHRRRFDFHPAATEDRNVKFDSSSGQVYIESTVGGWIETDWAWKTLGSRRFRRYTQQESAPSLESAAMRSVLANIGDFTAEVLENVPWHIGQRIWENTKRSELDSFRIWETFATAYHEEGDSSLIYRRQSIEQPTMALEQYVKTITSQSISWLTYLSFSIDAISRIELIKISKLVNLGALDIVAPIPSCTDSAMDDSVIRAWSCAAAEGKAFTKLRVLILRNHQGITKRSFEYLNSFSSLTLYMVLGCSVSFYDERAGRRLGWSCESGKKLLRTLCGDKSTTSSSDAPIHACFRIAGASKIKELGCSDISKTDSLPVLNFRLGPITGGNLGTSLQRHAMLCFQRQQSKVDETPPDAIAKRLNPQNNISGSRPAKKRKLKATKHQNFEDLLAGFGET